MLRSLLKLVPPKESGTTRFVQPRLEALEDRWCPSTLHVTAAAEVLPDHQVRLTGTVTGGPAAGLTVDFYGAVSASTTTDTEGNFSYTTSNASLGIVYATGNDMDTACADIAASPPDLLPLTLTQLNNDTVQVTGTLTGVDPGGKTVNFMGAGWGSATTDSSGNFSFTIDPICSGMLSAATTDAWGQTDTETTYVADNPPQIVDFSCFSEVANTWHFTGRVIDEYTEGLVIRFGGLLQGQTTVVNADGTFEFTYVFQSGTTGTVTAITTDWWGQDSEIVSDFVG